MHLGTAKQVPGTAIQIPTAANGIAVRWSSRAYAMKICRMQYIVTVTYIVHVYLATLCKHSVLFNEWLSEATECVTFVDFIMKYEMKW